MKKVAFLLIVLSGLSGCIVVEEGFVGVKKQFGEISDKPLRAGLHLFIPVVNEVELWDVKTQRHRTRIDLPSSEGLIVEVETSVLYRPVDVVSLRTTVGERYAQRVLDPELTNVFREVIGKQKVEEIIRNPEKLTEEARDQLAAILAPRGIEIEQLLVTDFKLPSKFKDSIERKLQAEQKALEKTFELQQAKKDAEIEIARAEGAAKAQEIVRRTLSPAYLQYLWISTLNENPNVIYVSTEANMPVFRTVGEPEKK